MASCLSTSRELSFEWSHHRISSIESKVKVILQNPIKQSGSERVNKSLLHVVEGLCKRLMFYFCGSLAEQLNPQKVQFTSIKV